jgi:hypothetical protein
MRNPCNKLILTAVISAASVSAQNINKFVISDEAAKKTRFV